MSARRHLEAVLLLRGGKMKGGWLEGEALHRILSCFGIAVAVASEGGRTRRLTVRVRSHPDFGPLMAVRRAGRPSPERILPLTDQDGRVMLDAIDLPCEGSEAELLGRVSQLVEEVPWLVELRAELLPAAAGQPASLGSGVRASFKAPS